MLRTGSRSNSVNLPESADMRPCVIIADDDELMRSLMAAALNEKGFDTIEVEDGAAALAALERRLPDLVLLDVDMPVMGGYEACQRIRAAERTQNLPVVIVTGNEDTESIDRAYECGATDFVSKPVNWSLIGYRMRYVLRSAKTRLALVSSEAHNRAMLEALPDRLILVSTTGVIETVIEQQKSDASSEPDLPNAYIGQPLDALLPAEVMRQAMQHIETAVADGKETSFEFSTTQQPVPRNAGDADDRSYHEVRVLPQAADLVLLILRNITERKQTDREIHRLAFYDTLTELPNRYAFIQHAGETLREANTECDRFLLCYFNLDHFKRINETLGHTAGDAALQQVAERFIEFRHRWGEQGYHLDVARLGSDEFAFLSNLSGVDDEKRILQALRSEFSVPINCDRHQLVVTISLGSTLYPDDGADIETLMRNTDKAISSAKLAGRNAHIAYSRSQHENTGDTLQLETELREAIEQEQLFLYFQPKFDLASGTLTGAEALLRWIHPDHGMVSPGVFIPIAEETGLIVDIDRWVVDRACRHLRDWLGKGLDPVPVSINLSGRAFSFDQPEITIQRAIHAQGIDAALLEVEITETVLMADPIAAAKTLGKLKAMGVRLAVDDFGTGYSSLGYLKRFPLDVLKIDREFITELEDNASDRTLCRAMISMARGLDLEVVAEGIETEGQRQFLIDEQCQTGQGFLLAKPMANDSFEEFLLDASLTAGKSLSEERSFISDIPPMVRT